MKQIERIQMMEQHLNRANEAIAHLKQALDNYQEVKESIKALSQYYGDEEWNQDFEDDENGRLPHDLKRGVLSEDGIWNMLQENRELMNDIMDTVSEAMKNRFYE